MALTILSFADYAAQAGNSVKSFALVRNPVQIFNSLSIAQKNFTQSELKQHQKTWIHRETNVREVLSDLRRGETNLMFATCKSLLTFLDDTM